MLSYIEDILQKLPDTGNKNIQWPTFGVEKH
jgi:hypothetical protein